MNLVCKAWLSVLVTTDNSKTIKINLLYSSFLSASIPHNISQPLGSEPLDISDQLLFHHFQAPCEQRVSFDILDWNINML